MNLHQVECAALATVGQTRAIYVDGARLTLVGPVAGEVLRGWLGQSWCVCPMTRQIIVWQHIRLVTGRTLSAPYVCARGVG